MAKYFDITDNETDAIKAFDFANAPTAEDFQALTASVIGGSQAGIAVVYAPLDPSGNAIVGRAGRIQLAKLDTFGNAATGTAVTINAPNLDPGAVNPPDPFQEFDICYFINSNAGRAVTVQPSATMDIPAAITLAADGDYLAVFRRNGAWHWLDSYPKPLADPSAAIALVGESLQVYTDVFGNQAITLDKTLVDLVSSRTGETPATGTIQVTATGSGGSVIAIVDEGGSLFAIGSYYYTGTVTASVVAAGLAADIEARKTAGQHGYSAAAVTDTVTVTVPAGRGTDANAYLLTAPVTGGCTVTVTSFAGGVNGSYQDETIEAIYGGIEGQIYMVRNAMPSNVLTFDVSTGITEACRIRPAEYVNLIYQSGAYRLAGMGMTYEDKIRISQIRAEAYGFQSKAAGQKYLAGFYLAPAADANLTNAAPSVTIGTANVAYGAHAFAVAGGAGTTDGTDLVLTVSGTSVQNDGTRTPGDSEIMVANCTAASLNGYYETSKKWVGQVTITLTSTGGTAFAFDFNYGLAKYDDLSNTQFIIKGIEVTGLADANDSGFDVELLHHKDTGWTYSAAAFVPGPTAIAQMTVDYVTETHLSSGDPFAWKKTGLTVPVAGDLTEGYMVRVTTGTNNSVAYLNAKIFIA